MARGSHESRVLWLQVALLAVAVMAVSLRRATGFTASTATSTSTARGRHGAGLTDTKARLTRITRHAQGDEDATTVTVSSRGKEVESLLRSFRDLQDETGTYVISSRAPVLVSPSKDLSPTPIAELSTGDIVEVIEYEVLQEAQRVRGRLEDPPGWISLRNPSSGFRWACPKQPQDEIDASLQKLEDLALKEDTPEAAEANADFLYLKALFGQSSAGLPLLRSFQSTKTWALFGRGLERWNAVAGTFLKLKHPDPVAINAFHLFHLFLVFVSLSSSAKVVWFSQSKLSKVVLDELHFFSPSMSNS